MDNKGVVSKAVRGIGLGVLVAALAACSTGNGGTASGTATLQQALNDYTAGNVTLAKSEFQTVVKNDPNDKYGWYNLGVIAQGAGNNSDAGKDYLKSLAIDPAFESALYNYGVLQFQADQIPSAISYLRRAVAANPGDANAHWNFGLALARTGKPADNKEATTELNKALKINPALIKSLDISPKSPLTSGSGLKAVGGTGASVGAVTTSSAP